MAGVLKGEPVRAFEYRQSAGLSDKWIDCRQANALTVQIDVTGTSPSATVSVEGAPLPSGVSLPLDDPQASQSLVTSSRSFDTSVGAAWVRLRLADVSGAFGENQGYTITATPYVAPGSGKLSISMGS